jgi:hypothetical protein
MNVFKQSSVRSQNKLCHCSALVWKRDTFIFFGNISFSGQMYMEGVYGNWINWLQAFMVAVWNPCVPSLHYT